MKILRAFLVAAPLALGAPTESLADVTLVPVPWTTASTSRLGLDCNGEPAGGFVAAGQGFPTDRVTLPATPEFDVSVGGLHARGRVISEISANQWRFGLEEFTVTAPNLPKAGDLIQNPNNTTFRLDLQLFPSASITVPDDGVGVTTPILFRGASPGFEDAFQDVRIAPVETGRCAPQDAKLGNPFDVLLPGSEVPLFGDLLWQVFITISGNWEPGGFRVTEVRTDILGPCSISSAASSPDCTLKLLALRPARSTAAPSLACKADLTGDGVVNFQDLARMKSVFFKSCPAQ